MREIAFGVAGVASLALVLGVVVNGVRRTSTDVEEGVSQKVRIGQLQAEVTGARAEAERLRQELARRKEEVKKERIAAGDLKKEVASSKADVGRLRRELEASRSETKREKDAADALRKKVAGLEQKAKH